MIAGIESNNNEHVIAQNLERRFAVLEQCKDTHNFFIAERDYIDFLEEEKGLYPTLEALAADKRYYDTMTRIIIVLSMPSDGNLKYVNVIRIPAFLEESPFKDISLEKIKDEEIKRRRATREAVTDEVTGSGSRERAHAIGTEVGHQSRISPIRKLHFAIVERLANKIIPTPDSVAQGTAKRLIHKDADGDFFYNGKLVKLSKENIAWHLLDILYQRYPTGGFMTYEEIGKELRGRNKGDGSPKSIQNALGEGQGFFRNANGGNSFPKTKSGTQWKHFTFQFLKDEELSVKVANGNDIDMRVTYKDVGCDDKRKRIKYPPYDLKWTLLLNLAKSNGEIAPGAEFFGAENEKAKETLTDRLQSYFHIADDPFFPVDSTQDHKKKGSYKFRADIFPPPSDPEEDESRDELSREIDEELRGLQGFKE